MADRGVEVRDHPDLLLDALEDRPRPLGRGGGGRRDDARGHAVSLPFEERDRSRERGREEAQHFGRLAANPISLAARREILEGAYAQARAAIARRDLESALAV
jgi:hypothetical protein